LAILVSLELKYRALQSALAVLLIPLVSTGLEPAVHAQGTARGGEAHGYS